MLYHHIKKAVFLKRPNRFIAHCVLNGEEVICHVKNTGRCKELLLEGATVYLEESDKANRKTKYDLVAVEKGDVLINMDSAAPNQAARVWLEAGGILQNPTLIKPEVKHGDSRFDFYIENESEKAFVEVKGVTLEQDGVALFPDAPTLRGTKHVNGLIECFNEGYGAYVLLVIQMKGVSVFRSNCATDPEFAHALKKAAGAGVRVLAVDCDVTPDDMVIDRFVTIEW